MEAPWLGRQYRDTEGTDGDDSGGGSSVGASFSTGMAYSPASPSNPYGYSNGQYNSGGTSSNSGGLTRNDDDTSGNAESYQSTYGASSGPIGSEYANPVDTASPIYSLAALWAQPGRDYSPTVEAYEREKLSQAIPGDDHPVYDSDTQSKRMAIKNDILDDDITDTAREKASDVTLKKYRDNPGKTAISIALAPGITALEAGASWLKNYFAPSKETLAASRDEGVSRFDTKAENGTLEQMVADRLAGKPEATTPGGNWGTSNNQNAQLARYDTPAVADAAPTPAETTTATPTTSTPIIEPDLLAGLSFFGKGFTPQRRG